MEGTHSISPVWWHSGLKYLILELPTGMIYWKEWIIYQVTQLTIRR